ncbi:MAG: NUDIX domain-containing protein [Actinomycetes bacterium]
MGTSEKPLHSVSVAAAILGDDGRLIATLRRDNGHWEPPGGALELGETIPEGLARELREELSVEIEAPVLTGVYKNLEQGIVALVFRCKLAGGPPRAGAEVSEWRWMTADEVVEHMDEAYAIRMLDALQGSPPAVRSHDGVHLRD